MPAFQYTALNKGKKETGSIEAGTEAEAIKILREKHLLITDIHSQKSAGFSLHLARSVPMKEKIIFTRQLSFMIKAGMPVVQALTALKEQTESPILKTALEKIMQEVKGGEPLSSSLAKYPKIFNPTYISVVASGEKSGKLEEVLNNLADQQEKDFDLISKVKSAMIYPLVILIALLGVMFLIVFYIMPQLESVFKDFGGELPASTKFLMSLSSNLRKYFYIYFSIIILLIVFSKQFTKYPRIRLWVDKLRISLPILGMMNKKIYMARFTHTLSMLISAGLPVLEAIKISGEVVNNSVYQKSFNDLFKGVEGGVPFSELLKKDKNFPPMLGHMCSIGEQSGNLDYVLSQIASFYEKEVETITRNLSTLIEPILMILMGIGVAFVVLSVLGPINSITNNI
ncbi:MAG: type II secretion system F family protein [bacterium]|nr:type II secretion system F family protein [bacterium]